MSHQNQQNRQPIFSREHSPAMAAFGGVALLGALALGPEIAGQDSAENHSQQTYEQAVTESAQDPLDRETETPVIDNIVVPAGMIPTEYIPSDPRVVEYVVQNQDEATAVTTSVNSLKTVDTNTYALVERDVDNDGDTDAVVTQVIEQ